MKDARFVSSLNKNPSLLMPVVSAFRRSRSYPHESRLTKGLNNFGRQQSDRRPANHVVSRATFYINLEKFYLFNSPSARSAKSIRIAISSTLKSLGLSSLTQNIHHPFVVSNHLNYIQFSHLFQYFPLLINSS